MTTIPNDWLESTEELETPFCYMSGAINPFAERAMLTTFLALARLCEALGVMMEEDHSVDKEELEAIGLTVSFALTAIGSTGLTARHPELDLMPEKVAPSEFMAKEGDTQEDLNDRLSEWVRSRIDGLFESEQKKISTTWN